MAGLKSSTVALMVVMTMILASTSMAQTRHVVGDALGWNIPPNGAAAYTTWASQQNFTVGDSLFFNFTTGFHNVAEVTQAAYGPCTTANPTSITTTGPATITLTTPGPHYYICTVGTHCQIGQKLTINVAAAATAPAPTTPPPASAPTTPPPAATPTPTPTPAPVSPPTTTPTPSPAPSTTTPPPTTSPSPSPVGAGPTSPTTPAGPTSPTTPGSSPSGSATPPTSDTTPPPPSPSTAARSFTIALPASFLAIVLAFFY